MGVKNRVGQLYGRLTVLKQIPDPNKKISWWECLCECGKLVVVKGGNLNSGNTKSCGCYSDESKVNRIKHGNNRKGNITSEYRSWASMKSRCTNENVIGYQEYGGRGIKVCDRWLNSFENFLDDMGKKPTPTHSLDRYPNNEDGNYEPSNCRWGTDEQQSKNRRSNKWYERNGVRMVQKDWAKSLGADNRQFHKMLKYKSFEDTYNHFLNRKLNK